MKRLLIIGPAKCVWDDLEGLDDSFGGDRMVLNAMGFHYPKRKVEHWASLHPKHFALVAQAWKFKSKFHAQKHVGVPMTVWDVRVKGGTTGLFAAQVGIMLGYDKIVLAGVPMTNTGHFYDPPDTIIGAHDCRQNRILWAQAKQEVFDDKVRSVSGNTKAWLGAPTEDWLNG